MGKKEGLTTREYVMAKLAIGGELASLRAPRQFPYNEKSVSRELGEMESDKLIHHYRSSSGMKTIRVSSPAGYNAIEALSPTLLRHADLMIGEKGKRYYGSQKRREKKARDSNVVNLYEKLGIPVDGITLERSGFEILCADYSLEGIITASDKALPFFITGSLLRNSNTNSSSKWLQSTISAGTLISPGGVYTCFAPSENPPRLKVRTEIDIQSELKAMCETAFKTKLSSDNRLKAIFYTRNESAMRTLLDNEKRRYSIRVTQTFGLSYVVPLTENAEDITKMLCIRNWRSKCNKVLGLESGGQSDGIAEDGKPIYNLLCFNLGRTNGLRAHIENNAAHFIVHDWQKELIEKVYGASLDAIVIDGTKFKGLLGLVERL